MHKIARETAHKHNVLVMNKYYFKKMAKGAHNETKEVKLRSTATKPKLVNKLDRIFSLYIRLRDVMPNGYVRCISCGQIKSFEDVDCGHFHSRRHMATRFDEDNCHAECKYDNRFSADHLIDYQRNLLRKIGQQRFDRLNIKAHSTLHYLDSELERMITYYTAEVKKLSSLKGIKVKI